MVELLSFVYYVFMKATETTTPEKKVQWTNTQEFYEMRAGFEKLAKSSNSNLPKGRFDREDKTLGKQGAWYQDGQINNAFIAFMHGYQFHRVHSQGVMI